MQSHFAGEGSTKDAQPAAMLGGIPVGVRCVADWTEWVDAGTLSVLAPDA